MQLPEKFKAYAALVCKQLRWKKARPIIAREIETHLCDQYDALVKSGLSEEEAIEESIRQMGDAVEIGTSLDRVHKPKPSWSLMVLTGILLLLGFGIHMFVSYDSDFSHLLLKHIIFAMIGVGCLVGAYFLDFTILGKRPLLFFIGAIALIGYVILRYPPHVAAQLILLLPLSYTALLYWLRGKKYLGLVLSYAGLALLCLCCSAIPSMAGTLIVATTGIALLTVVLWGDWFQVGKRRGLMVSGALILLGAAAVLLRIQNSGYMTRIQVAFHPELDPTGRGWTGMLIRETLAGARLLGEGTVGTYAPTILHNTDLYTDLFLTYLVYRTGWLSFIIIAAVFIAFFAVAVRKCLKQKNMLGRLVSLAVILTLVLQVAFYMASNFGIQLVGNISLPLVSYGNTALAVNMALIGAMLSVFRTGSLVRNVEQLPRNGKKRFQLKDYFRWKNGELTISFKRKIAS